MHKRTSEIFTDVIANAEGSGEITVREILELLGKKSFCLAVLVLALPNCIPIPNPPGLATLTGVPIMLLAIQMVWGRNAPWIPKRMANYSFSREKFANFLKKSLPYIYKIERIFYPRMFWLGIGVSQRLIGTAFLILGFIISLPIPFANLVPGFAIACMAIGLMERDGLMMAIGLAIGAVGSMAMFKLIKGVVMGVMGL